jgi:translation elongation factor EF-G
LSQGRATPYIEPSHYEEVPNNIANILIAQKTGIVAA